MPLYANRPSRSSRSRKRQCLSSESDVPCQACLRTWSADVGPLRIADPPLSFRPWAGRAGRTACFKGQRWLSRPADERRLSSGREAFGELGLGGEKACAGAGQGKEKPSRVVELNSSRGARHGPAAGQEGWASEWTLPARARGREQQPEVTEPPAGHDVPPAAIGASQSHRMVAASHAESRAAHDWRRRRCGGRMGTGRSAAAHGSLRLQRHGRNASARALQPSLGPPARAPDPAVCRRPRRPF
jgi:hypothetical protein